MIAAAPLRDHVAHVAVSAMLVVLILAALALGVGIVFAPTAPQTAVDAGAQ